jgi:TPP-dependent pyruvate/acetoin dehydrogenase alpha subunit
VPAELRASFADRDPIELLAAQIGPGAAVVRHAVLEEVSAALAEAEASAAPDPAAMKHGVYASPV